METEKVVVPAVTTGKVDECFDPATKAHFVEMIVDEDGKRVPNQEKGILTYDELYDGTAMPSSGRHKKLKEPAPSMERLPPRPFSEPECHNEREWGGFLPLAMVATLIPSKKVESMKVNGVTGRQAINNEWENLSKRGCWDETRMKKLVDVIREAEQERRIIHIGSMLELL